MLQAVSLLLTAELAMPGIAASEKTLCYSLKALYSHETVLHGISVDKSFGKLHHGLGLIISRVHLCM